MTDTVNLWLFLAQVFLISFSGAMSPGPVTTASIALGTQNRWAGSLIAIGHAFLEFPLMILIMFGLDTLLKSSATKIIIGFIGGIVLIWMAVMMFFPSGSKPDKKTHIAKGRPVLTGFLLSATNPYFLIWWATIGLTLATRAKQFGIWAFALFTFAHWLTDLIWISAISWTSFKGTAILGPKPMEIVLRICAAIMFFFGLFFIYSALISLAR